MARSNTFYAFSLPYIAQIMSENELIANATILRDQSFYSEVLNVNSYGGIYSFCKDLPYLVIPSSILINGKECKVTRIFRISEEHHVNTLFIPSSIKYIELSETIDDRGSDDYGMTLASKLVCENIIFETTTGWTEYTNDSATSIEESELLNPADAATRLNAFKSYTGGPGSDLLPTYWQRS